MADFASGPVILSAVRAQAIDYTSTIWMDNMRIVSGRGTAEIDPWSFFLPLDSLVWASFLVASMVMLALLSLLSFCFRDPVSFSNKGTGHSFNLVRVVLQQGKISPSLQKMTIVDLSHYVGLWFAWLLFSNFPYL